MVCCGPCILQVQCHMQSAMIVGNRDIILSGSQADKEVEGQADKPAVHTLFSSIAVKTAL